MTIERTVLGFAGSVILLSLGLAVCVNPYWLLLTGFVGPNMLQAAVTGICPIAILRHALGLRPGPAFRV